MDKEAMMDFTAILSPLVNLATLLSCHFVKIKITYFIESNCLCIRLVFFKTCGVLFLNFNNSLSVTLIKFSSLFFSLGFSASFNNFWDSFITFFTDLIESKCPVRYLSINNCRSSFCNRSSSSLTFFFPGDTHP
jgi:hypothetical protein